MRKAPWLEDHTPAYVDITVETDDGETINTRSADLVGRESVERWLNGPSMDAFETILNDTETVVFYDIAVVAGDERRAV